MRVSFIGSGNVATHLALAMYNRGHVVDQIWSRNIDHARLLAERVQADPIDDINWLRTTANIYILAVSDDAIFSMAPMLRLGKALVLHTSGATTINVLEHTSTRYGVLWSPQSFVRDVAMDYGELPFCIEGCDEDTEHDIEEFISMISSHIYHTNYDQRQHLHLSAVLVNNFANCLYGVAQQLCDKQGVPFEILHPIIDTTTRKVRWGDVRFQITGPAARNDKKTLDAHRLLLADDPRILKLYNEMSRLIQTRMKL